FIVTLSPLIYPNASAQMIQEIANRATVFGNLIEDIILNLTSLTDKFSPDEAQGISIKGHVNFVFTSRIVKSFAKLVAEYLGRIRLERSDAPKVTPLFSLAAKFTDDHCLQVEGDINK